MRSVVVGTAGHIDHGKSALVRALTGTDPDRLEEEKARGITIDLGFAHLVVADVNLAFVDVPGHERFVKNMLAGAGGINLVLLVVAADEGVMPQTREHFDICRLLGVRAGVVALTKADLVDTEGLEAARSEVGDLVAGSFLESAAVVPVSSVTGEGLDHLAAALASSARQVATRNANGVTRLPIDRAFSLRGFGTVVTGTLVSGRLGPNTQLRLEPGGRDVSVRGIQVHGTARADAMAGERVAVNLAATDVHHAERGHSLVSPGAIETTVLADAAIELLPSAAPLKHGARVRFHQGTAEVLARVAVIGPQDAGEPFAAIAPGAHGFVRLRLEGPAVLVRGDRYILRAYSPMVTMAGGVILDPQPPRVAVRSSAALARCRVLAGEDEIDPSGQGPAPLSVVGFLMEEAGLSGLPVSGLVSRLGLDPLAAAQAVQSLLRGSHAVQVGDMLVACTAMDALKRSVALALEAHHRGDALSDGMPREELRMRLLPRGSPQVFDQALEQLSGEGLVAGRDRIRLASHRVVLPAADERALETIERTLRAAALCPPDLLGLASSSGVATAVAERLVQMLQRQRRVTKVDALIFHEEALARLKLDVAEMKHPGAGDATIDVATFKERFGVTRKFAIPLLEYLDRERVTRRVGASRVIL